MKGRIRLYSYHTFLVIPFVILFLFNQNKEQVWEGMLIRPVIIGIAVTFLLFGLFYWLLRDRLRTGVFVSLLMMGLLQYGVVYDFFERMYYAGTWPLGNIHRYLLITFFLFYLGLFWYIKQSKRTFIRVNLFLNMMLLMLFLFNLLQIFTEKNQKVHDSNSHEEMAILPKNKGALPDIFYIVLDGYAASNVLHKYYQFDNSEFIDKLRANKFAVADSAKSNYYYTSHSLGSTLNMDFLGTPQTVGRIKNNRLFAGLKTAGYRIYNMESGYAVTGAFENTDSTITIEGPNEFEKSLLRTTILRLDDLFGFIPRMRLVSQFEKMFVLPEIKATPKFVFLHIVAPHPPYVFKADGTVKMRGVSENSWEPASSYVEQLKYVNSQIISLTEKIIKFSPQAVIVLQADHGPWISAKTPSEVFEARSGILYAIYPAIKFPINNHPTSVNTFRMVMDTVLGTKMGPLSDSLAGRLDLLEDPILLKKSNTKHK